MSDRQRLGRIGNGARTITGEIERILGEMSDVQQARVVGAVLGFWCCEEDIDHPRPDGRSWKDVLKQELER